MSVRLNRKVPAFALPATGGKKVRLAELRGKKIVLYFYPKDHTPGCSRESADFSRLAGRFAKHNAVILGVSRDNMRSHEKFREKLGLSFDLVEDQEETLCRMFGVLKEKTMFGRKVTGIERSTFLIDEQGVLRQEWRKVRVDGHAAKVLTAAAGAAAKD